MNKYLKSTLLLFIAFVFTGCSSIQVSQDYEQGFDHSSLKAFAWLPNDNNEWGLTNNDLVDRRIRSAITDTLKAKPFIMKDVDTADFLVSYNVVIEQRVSRTNISGSVSMGRSTRGRSGTVGMSTGSHVRTYDRGTMLIDIHDVASNKLVWRGVSIQALTDLTDSQRLTTRINDTVEAILKQFPPK